MKVFFDEQIDQIISLTSAEIQRCLNLKHTVNVRNSRTRHLMHANYTQRILLTGGLAANPYYLTRIQTEFPNIIIERPHSE
jgi:hypothetical protein